jgi:hypothetical protein
VGLEDRDWYREEPSKAWKRRWSSAAPSYQSSTAGGRPRTLGAKRKIRRWFVPLAVGAAIPVAAAVGWENRLSLRDAADGLSSRASGPPAVIVPTPLPGATSNAKVVHLRSHAGLDVPAQRVTRWSITDPRFGRVSVYVPVGSTPREALTIALAERGFQVVPSRP